MPVIFLINLIKYGGLYILHFTMFFLLFLWLYMEHMHLNEPMKI